MLIAIHGLTHCQDGYAEGWAECLATRCIDVRWVDLTAHDALQRVQDCDGVMWHWSRTSKDKTIYRILNVIELYLGIPVFPNHGSSWHRRDKLSQYYLFQAARVPRPETWVFWDKQSAREWALRTDYPKVFKLSIGGGGKGVVLVSSAVQACRLIDRMFGAGLASGQIEQHLIGGMPRNWQHLRALASRCEAATRYVTRGWPPSSSVEKGYVYFQEFVPGNDHKIGIVVIGDRSYGSLRFNEPNNFQSNGEKYDYNPSHINLKCVQMAFDISERLGFPMMAYDFLLSLGEPVVLEMNFKDGKTRGYWKRDLEWVSEPMYPQEAQVETFLNEIRSRHGKLGSIPGPYHAGPAGPKMAM